MRQTPIGTKRKPKYLFFYVILSSFILGYLLYKGVTVFSHSLFVSSPDRINFVMYGPQTRYYSLDTKTNRHYEISFPPDLKVDVPGGYGQYRVGSLGKLAELDGNAHLLEKTFAATTTTFIHYYFFPDSDEVYYGSDIEESAKKPSVLHVLFWSGNASVLDRLYLSLMLLGKKDTQFNLISYRKETDNVLGDTVFRNDTFMKKSIGLLYQANYREEQASVQILYPHEYKTAMRISTLLEGNGIRVSDVSLDIDRSDTCEVIFSTEVPSQTARDISSYFTCPLVNGKTDVYDIIFVLGMREKDWEIE
ncbi:hypothetical protein IPM65_04355 [Candidatus Roizmanbacteria bacterium]|nr:MAG: hypothetical protein IPM65_04355 [Candidatus Roizmanbacteria bacterium]